MTLASYLRPNVRNVSPAASQKRSCGLGGDADVASQNAILAIVGCSIPIRRENSIIARTFRGGLIGILEPAGHLLRGVFQFVVVFFCLERVLFGQIAKFRGKVELSEKFREREWRFANRFRSTRPSITRPSFCQRSRRPRRSNCPRPTAAQAARNAVGTIKRTSGAGSEDCNRNRRADPGRRQ
jgi:hypothetical protein